MHVLGTGNTSQWIKMVVQEAWWLEFKQQIPHKGEWRKQTTQDQTFTNAALQYTPSHWVRLKKYIKLNTLKNHAEFIILIFIRYKFKNKIYIIYRYQILNQNIFKFS